MKLIYLKISKQELSKTEIQTFWQYKWNLTSFLTGKVKPRKSLWLVQAANLLAVNLLAIQLLEANLLAANLLANIC